MYSSGGGVPKDDAKAREYQRVTDSADTDRERFLGTVLVPACPCEHVVSRELCQRPWSKESLEYDPRRDFASAFETSCRLVQAPSHRRGVRLEAFCGLRVSSARPLANSLLARAIDMSGIERARAVATLPRSVVKPTKAADDVRPGR